MNLRYTWSAKETRLLRKEGMIERIGDNAANVIGGSFREHVSVPFKRGKYVKATFGGLVAVVDSVLNAPDAAVAGVFGQEIPELKPRHFDRTLRDIGIVTDETINAVGNVVTVRPVKFVGNVARGGLGVLRTIGSDIPTDAIDAIGGYDVIDRAEAQTRARIEQQYSLEA